MSRAFVVARSKNGLTSRERNRRPVLNLGVAFTVAVNVTAWLTLEGFVEHVIVVVLAERSEFSSTPTVPGLPARLLDWFATTKSGLPSPFTSPIATVPA